MNFIHFKRVFIDKHGSANPNAIVMIDCPETDLLTTTVDTLNFTHFKRVFIDKHGSANPNAIVMIDCPETDLLTSLVIKLP